VTTAGDDKRPIVTESKRQMLKEMAEKSADGLSRDQKEQLSQLVLEYADIFAKDGELGQTNKIKHLINTGDAECFTLSMSSPEREFQQTGPRLTRWQGGQHHSQRERSNSSSVWQCTIGDLFAILQQ